MSFPRYPAYKDSGVEWLGEVPEHWEGLRLRFVVTLNPSKQEARSYADDDLVSFLPMEAIGEDGSLSLEIEKEVGECLSGYTYFTEGDVCIAKITPCFENGKGAILRGLKGGIGFGTTELIVARPKEGRLTAEFLDYLFRSNPFRELGEASMYGAGGQKRVPDAYVRDFSAFLPSLNEQQVIATFLDRETAKIDALIAEQLRLIELLQEKRQAVISHAVTKGLNPDAPMKDSGVEWLGEVPEHWETKRLKDIAEVIDCRNKTPDYVDDGRFLVVRTTNIKNRQLSLEDAKYTDEKNFKIWTARGVPRPGSILFTREAPSGETALVPDGIPLCLGQRMMNIDLKDCTLTAFTLCFLQSACLSHYIEACSMGSTVSHLRVPQVENLPVPIPPIEEQKAIIDAVGLLDSTCDQLASDLDSSVALLQERRSALISAAVTGQIDVRGLVPEACAA